MSKLHSLALCAILTGMALAVPAEAQQINIPNSANSQIEAKTARLRATGNGFEESWKSTTNTDCSDVVIGTDASSVKDTGVPEYGVVDHGPGETNIVTGDITNLCFGRGR